MHPRSAASVPSVLSDRSQGQMSRDAALVLKAARKAPPAPVAVPSIPSSAGRSASQLATSQTSGAALYSSAPAPFRSSTPDLPRAGNIGVMERDDDESELFDTVRGTLLRRQDSAGSKDGAAPKRYYEYRAAEESDTLLELCNKKLEANPGNAKALFIRASLLLKRQNYKAAADDYQELVRQNPNDVNALYNAGCAYEKLQDWDLAINFFSAVLKIDPNNASSAYARASCLNYKGNFDQAIEDYERALQTDQLDQVQVASSNREEAREPGTPMRRTSLHRVSTQDVHDMRATSSPIGSPAASSRDSHTHADIITPAATPGYGRSIDDLNRSRASRTAVEDTIKDQVRGIVSTTMNNLIKKQAAATAPAATAVLQNGENGDPHHLQQVAALTAPASVNSDSLKNADYYHSRGYALRKRGDFVAAIADYTRAISLDPRHFKAYFNRGFSYDKLGEYDRAIQDYTTALAVSPNNAYALYNRGISQDRKGDFVAAIQDFTLALQVDSTNADFFHNRGFSNRKLGNYEAAVVDYSRALELNPKHFKAFYNRAFAYDKMGDFQSAIWDYTQALKIDTDNANAYHNRGSSYEKLNRNEDALSDFSRAIALDPSNASSFNSRGLVLDKMGRFSEGIDDFTAAIEREPDNAVFYHNRGYCFRNFGKYELAIEDYTQVPRRFALSQIFRMTAFQALNFNPANPTAYNNRGFARRKVPD
jgi:tetratricopeptide (TPR) repeat protein